MKKVLFISIIFLFCFFLLEGMLRVYLIARYDSPLVVMRKFGYDRQPLMGFEVMPNISNQYFPSIDTKFSSNSKGLRGIGELGRKDRDEIRIGIMGGSCAFGFGASDDHHTLAGQLQKRLQELAPQKKWTVINGGTPAYISYQVLARLQLRFIELEPDYMIFYMGWNDLFLQLPHLSGRNRFLKQDSVYELDSWQYFITIFNQTNMPIYGTNPFAITFFLKRVYLKCFPENLIFDQISQSGVATNATDTNNLPSVPLDYTTSQEQRQAVLAMLKDNLTSIAGICQAHKIQAIFSSLISDVNLFGNDRALINQTIQAVALAQNTLFVDSDTYVKDKQLTGLNNSTDKYHLTDKGNEVLADYWAAQILKLNSD